jgi:hypothetical protein
MVQRLKIQAREEPLLLQNGEKRITQAIIQRNLSMTQDEILICTLRAEMH